MRIAPKYFYSVFFILFLLLLGLQLRAQGSNEDWYADEETTTDAGLKKYAEPEILLNGSLVDVKTVVPISQEKPIDIAVDGLAPGTLMIVEAKKGSLSLYKQSFVSNSQGQLRLEVNIVEKLNLKVGGTLVLDFFNQKKEKRHLEVAVKLQ